jgi:hypothetical protein
MVAIIYSEPVKAEHVATIDSTSGEHYVLDRHGDIYLLSGIDGFLASGIWAGDIELYLEGPDGCWARATRVGHIINWEIHDPYAQ